MVYKIAARKRCALDIYTIEHYIEVKEFKRDEDAISFCMKYAPIHGCICSRVELGKPDVTIFIQGLGAKDASNNS